MRSSHRYSPLLGLLAVLNLGAAAPPPQRTAPCQGDARSTAFDYWLGTWDVRAYGKGESAPLHENVITLEQDGCVIQEHWRGAADASGSRYTGTSFTVFDRARGIWHQTWVDNQGALAVFEGAVDAKGDLILARLALPGDKPDGTERRMSYRQQPDGSVRQVVERSKDGGATWTTAIDLHYVRRAPG